MRGPRAPPAPRLAPAGAQPGAACLPPPPRRCRLRCWAAAPVDPAEASARHAPAGACAAVTDSPGGERPRPAEAPRTLQHRAVARHAVERFAAGARRVGFGCGVVTTYAIEALAELQHEASHQARPECGRR